MRSNYPSVPSPADINEDFAWELKFLANELGHELIMLVLGSGRRRKLAQDWQRFVNATTGLGSFSGVNAACSTMATHVIVHIFDVGWLGWGARSRLEWTYAMAIDQALRYALAAWTAEVTR